MCDGWLTNTSEHLYENSSFGLCIWNTSKIICTKRKKDKCGKTGCSHFVSNTSFFTFKYRQKLRADKTQWRWWQTKQADKYNSSLKAPPRYQNTEEEQTTSFIDASHTVTQDGCFMSECTLVHQYCKYKSCTHTHTHSHDQLVLFRNVRFTKMMYIGWSWLVFPASWMKCDEDLYKWWRENNRFWDLNVWDECNSEKVQCLLIRSGLNLFQLNALTMNVPLKFVKLMKHAITWRRMCSDSFQHDVEKNNLSFIWMGSLHCCGGLPKQKHMGGGGIILFTSYSSRPQDERTLLEAATWVSSDKKIV